MTVRELFIYPVKSLGGISLASSVVTERGLAYDRRWVLADASGRFITQRTHPEMALFAVNLEKDRLVVIHRLKKARLEVPFVPETREEKRISIWDDVVAAVRVSNEADAWFSHHLGFGCELFFQPDHSVRKVDERYRVTGEEHTSFSDAYPALLISRESLDDLNSRLAVKTDMRRFRPNIVIEGIEPYGEDQLKGLEIGSAVFQGVKLCSRCILTTIDPDADEPKVAAEPLKTLASYRKNGNKVLFGQNLVVHREGMISVGDQVFVL